MKNKVHSSRFLTDSDARLVGAACEGEKKAFVEIVRRYQNLVTGVTLAILKDFSLSEDAAQDAFVIAWQKMTTLKNPESLRTWLAQIARNTALNYSRKRRPEESFELSNLTLIDERSRPDEAAITQDEKEVVISALDALPEKYRLPLVLYYREDQSIEIVAKSLSQSKATVRKQLSRGRLLLRDQMISVLKTALPRSVPGPVFTATVAGVLGAMLKPTAVAATAFSAKPLTTTATAMTTSKLTLTAAAIVAVCLPVGYHARANLREAPISSKTLSSSLGLSNSKNEVIAESELAAEWKRMQNEHGSDLVALHGEIEEVPNSLRRRAFQALLLSHWAGLDSEGGLAFYTKEEDRLQIMREWLKSDSQAAVETLLENVELVPELLAQIATLSPSRLAEVVGKVPPKNHAGILKTWDAFEILAGNDVDSARRIANELEGAQRINALRGIGISWGQSDFPAALKWAETFENPEDKRLILGGVYQGLASIDPGLALQKVSTLTVRSSGNLEPIWRVVKAAGETDFDGTAAWLKEHPGDISYPRGALEAALAKRLVPDPAGYLSKLESDGALEVLFPALIEVIHGSSPPDFGEVWDWIQQADQTAIVARLKNKFIFHVGFEQPHQAMAMIDTMEPGPEKEEVMRVGREMILASATEVDRGPEFIKELTPEWQLEMIGQIHGWTETAKSPDAKVHQLLRDVLRNSTLSETEKAPFIR